MGAAGRAEVQGGRGSGGSIMIFGNFTMCKTSNVTRHTSRVTRHASHVTRHTSHVTPHTSHNPPPTCTSQSTAQTPCAHGACFSFRPTLPHLHSSPAVILRKSHLAPRRPSPKRAPGQQRPAAYAQCVCKQAAQVQRQRHALRCNTRVDSDPACCSVVKQWRRRHKAT